MAFGRDAGEADRENMELSRKRMEQIRDVVDVRLQDQLGPGVTIDYDLEYADPDATGTVLLTSEPHGSKDALREAKGNRNANDPYFRRVDVYVDDSATTRNYAGRSVPHTNKQVKITSTHWQARVRTHAHASLIAAAGIVSVRLRNGDTGREGDFHVIGVGVGDKHGIGVDVSLSDDYTDFYTDDPVGFEDFDGAGVNYSTFGFSLGIGYAMSYLSFPRMGDGAKDIPVGGWSLGAQLGGIEGGDSLSSSLGADGSGPPSDYYDVPTDYDTTSSDTKSIDADLYTAFFDTGKWVLAPRDRTELRKFVDAASLKFRQSVH